MFNEKWECFYGGQFWLISTIIQFYLCWPLIIKLFKNNGIITAVIISLLWATTTTYLGLSEQRIWNSFFLQYLWEFVLGMWLANIYFNKPYKFTIPPYKWLIPISIIGLLLTGITGCNGGFLKSFNDIPSLFGYLSIALIIYKLTIKIINSFFSYTNSISYEWYLVHYLIFGCCTHYLHMINCPIVFQAIIGLLTSYLNAIIYHQVLHKIKLI